MIAYVFWHVRQPSVDANAFEQGLASFHAGLADRPPAGFGSSLSHRCGRLPWIEDASYEDWYLVHDFASLGVLNEHAAAGGHAGAHDRVASYSAHGTGAVYEMEAGEAGLRPERLYWLDRPRDMMTADFLAGMRRRVAEQGGVLWRRQLSLGPAREYCVHARRTLDVPYPYIEIIPESLVWPA